MLTGVGSWYNEQKQMYPRIIVGKISPSLTLHGILNP